MTVTEDSTQSLHQKKNTTTTSQTYIDYITYVDYRALPRNVVIRQLNSTAQKKKKNSNYVATRDVRDPNCAKRHKTRL